MILEVRLSNFFSIKEEIVLDMRASDSNSKKNLDLLDNTFKCNDERILKSAVIYGANASGKSNIIKAIRFCRSMVLSSHLNNENTVFDFSPFKFDEYNKKESYFLVKFIINDIEYEYSFSLTNTEIVREELYYYPNGRRAKIFARNKKNGKEKNKIYSFSSAIHKPMDVAENTSRKTLYISRASQLDREIPKMIFSFFSNSFILDYPTLNDKEIENLYNQNREHLLKALNMADSDIVDISLKEGLFFKTFHKANKDVQFDLMSEESKGTQVLFSLMLVVIDIVKNNKVLLIDEIETSLHSKIVEYIVELFHVSSSAQIIFTTHNTSLLNLNKLRKDQIYFVNKKEDGSSDLYSLFDYKDFRDNMNVEKAYLQGRFDAIPYIDSSLENLRSIVK
ncbi:MAG: ATP-binding protein [Fibromonadaceae bacterium]|jgi:AAA15 family ATPase/GTPase|nr:ATP-binding protein [Fibromonadaceae bacterium]